MTRIAGPSREQLDALGDDYAGLIARTLAQVADDLTGVVGPVSGPEDLVEIRTSWAIAVESVLLPALGVGFEVGAATIRVGLREAVGVVASGGTLGSVPLDDSEPQRSSDLASGSDPAPAKQPGRLLAAAWTDVPATSDALAEHYLAQARNRLVGVGDELWAHAREELLEGLRQGEGIPELAARVRKVAPDLTEPRASVIARSEVLGAVNAGALEQVLATGATGTKEWVAADDERTRHTHDKADEQAVPLREHFTVGGFPMQRPHDPAGPPQETISCRCSLGYDLDLPPLEPVTLEIGPVDLDPEPGPPPPLRTIVSPQKEDRSFLARVFGDGLAALVGWFKARTASALDTGDDLGPDGHRPPLQLPPAADRGTPAGARAGEGGSPTGGAEPERAVAGGSGEVAGGDQAGGVDVLGERGSGPAAGRGLVAASEPNTGAMVALVPSKADLGRLPLGDVDGAEAREDIHLTLAFLGEAADWPPEARTSLLGGLQHAGLLHAVQGDGFGAGHWNVGSDSPSWNLQVGGVELEIAHDAVWGALRDTQLPALLPEQHAPWSPHVCLAYSADPGLAVVVAARSGPIVFDRLRVAFGEDVMDLPLTTVTLDQMFELGEDEMTAAATEPDGITQEDAWEADGAACDGSCSQETADPASAAAATLDDYRPPADWFTDPHLLEPTGITVTEDGQVFGHAATFASCHIGFGEGPGQCVTPPHELDHPYFLTGEVVTADGSRVGVGQVTLGTGHAPLTHGAQRAAEHYDHTGSVVADVTCGNDEHGIWVAGAVRPGVEPARIHELRASGQLSGDWRRIGGQLRLVALLAVNVPGFPVPRPRARVASGDPMALVAAGKVAHEAGQGGPDLSRVKERIAASMGRDRPSRLAEARERVEAGRS